MSDFSVQYPNRCETLHLVKMLNIDVYIVNVSRATDHTTLHNAS